MLKNLHSSALIILPKYNDKASYQNLTIFFDGSKIVLSETVKYLGSCVQIYDDLTFNAHIYFFHSRLSRTLGVMFKIEDYLSRNDLLLLYNTLFHPHLSCCISAWSSAFSALLNPLQTLQNKVIKFIEGLGHWQSSRLLHIKETKHSQNK